MLPTIKACVFNIFIVTMNQRIVSLRGHLYVMETEIYHPKLLFSHCFSFVVYSSITLFITLNTEMIMK